MVWTIGGALKLTDCPKPYLDQALTPEQQKLLFPIVELIEKSLQCSGICTVSREYLLLGLD
jgi:hypothetical protein